MNEKLQNARDDLLKAIKKHKQDLNRLKQKHVKKLSQ